jgi:hypothetical protein
MNTISDLRLLIYTEKRLIGLLPRKLPRTLFFHHFGRIQHIIHQLTIGNSTNKTMNDIRDFLTAKKTEYFFDIMMGGSPTIS